MIELRNVRKTYVTKRLLRSNDETEAVVGLNLQIDRGGFGLLGINGAGKTTTIKMMATLLRPTDGTILLDGADSIHNESVIRAKVNMITGSDRMLYFRLSGRENLEYFAALYGMTGKEAKVHADRLLEFVNLSREGNRRVEQYSRGMKQRLSIARGLINDPEYLFLDEPTLGLDVEFASEIRSFIRDRLLSDPRRTVVLTSHYMKEVEELCPNIAILDKGHMIFHGSPAELNCRLGLSTRHSFTCSVTSQDQVNRILKSIGKNTECSEIKAREMRFSVRSDSPIASKIIEVLNRNDARDIRYESERPDLEEAVLSLSSRITA